jgi:hypothetical protein
MADHTTETRNAKLIITIACIVAIVVLSLARLVNPEFKVDLIVYALIGGILFGVNDIIKLLGSISVRLPEEKPSKKGKKR